MWKLQQQNEDEKKNCVQSMFHAMKTECGTEILENAIISVLNTASPSDYSKLKTMCAQYSSPFSTHSWFMRSKSTEEKSLEQIRSCVEQLQELARQDVLQDVDEVYYLDVPEKTFGK